MNMVLGCMGIDGEGSLTQEALDGLAEMAEGVHARARWAVPCDPRDLARSEGVMLHGCEVEALLTDRAFFMATGDRREDGLSIATGLAGVLLLRQRRYTALRTSALAAELLVPEWSLDCDHGWAPLWLLRVRARVLRAA